MTSVTGIQQKQNGDTGQYVSAGTAGHFQYEGDHCNTHDKIGGCWRDAYPVHQFIHFHNQVGYAECSCKHKEKIPQGNAMAFGMFSCAVNRKSKNKTEPDMAAIENPGGDREENQAVNVKQRHGHAHDADEHVPVSRQFPFRHAFIFKFGDIDFRILFFEKHVITLNLFEKIFCGLRLIFKD